MGAIRLSNNVGSPSREQVSGFQKAMSKEVVLFKKRFDVKAKAALFSELGIMLGSSLPITDALEIIAEDSKKENKTVIASLNEAIKNGCTLHDAMAAHKKVFTEYDWQTVKIGEETGKLPEVLNELASYYLSIVKFRRQVSGVFAYPVIVITVAIAIVYFMLSVVVPIFAEIFKQTGHQLPELTLLLIAASDAAPQMALTFILFAGSVFGFHLYYKKNDRYRRYVSSMVLKIPGVGPLVQKIYLARFCQCMMLLTSSRVMVHEALRMVRDMIGFYPLELAIDQVADDVVNRGDALNESLSRHRIFPKKLVALIRLSEEVNAPEEMYRRIYEQYRAEIEHRQALLSKTIEPVFILVLGTFVGLILVAMYMPMFEMSSQSF